MKFKYTGSDEEIALRGVTFAKGKAVDVADESLQAKLEKLDYFQKVKSRAKNKA